MNEKVDIGQALTALGILHEIFGEAYMMHRYGDKLADPGDSELKQAWDEIVELKNETQTWRRRLLRSGYSPPDDWLTAAVVGYPVAFKDEEGTPCYRLKLDNPDEIKRIFREIEATVLRLESRPGAPELHEREYTELIIPPPPEDNGIDDIPLGPAKRPRGRQAKPGFKAEVIRLYETGEFPTITDLAKHLKKHRTHVSHIVNDHKRQTNDRDKTVN